MTLKELKEPYINEINISNKYKNINCQELISLLDTCDDKDKDLITSILIVKSWGSLVNIYSKQDKSLKINMLSEEECYDIFLEAFEYIIKTRPWESDGNILHGDDNAFVKAMMQCTKSRKLNKYISNNRQKRVLSNYSTSLDELNEDFREGYFDNIEGMDVEQLYTSEFESVIKKLFDKKNYIDAFILDAILNFNVFNDDNNFNCKKLKKHLRNINDSFCKVFSEKYELNPQEVLYCKKYFIYKSDKELYNSIEKSLKNIKTYTQFILKGEF